MPLSLKIAKVCLHLATLCFFVGGLFAAGMALLALGSSHPNAQLQQAVVPNGMALGGLALILASAMEYTARGLASEKRWALVVCAILFLLFIPTVFLPLGFVGLVALTFYVRHRWIVLGERVLP